MKKLFCVDDDLHPILIIAAVSVFLFCGTGIAGIMGWLPASAGEVAVTAAAAAPAVPGQSNSAASSGMPPVHEPARAEQSLAHAGNGSRDNSSTMAAAHTIPRWCGSCGNIESSHEINARGAGVASAANELAENLSPRRRYEVRVRLDDGSLRVFHQAGKPAWRTGERVRLAAGTIEKLG